MNAALTPPDLRLLAPAFAGRFSLIIAGLVALIARAFLHDPKLAPLIVPLFRRLNRSARGIATLMARLAAGRRAAQRNGGDSSRGRPAAERPRGQAPQECSRTPRPPIPATEAWLVCTLRHEAAGYASQLSHLLAEPGISELLAAAPTAGRLLRPLCRMLGVSPAALGAVGRDRCTNAAQRSGGSSDRGAPVPRERC